MHADLVPYNINSVVEYETGEHWIRTSGTLDQADRLANACFWDRAARSLVARMAKHGKACVEDVGSLFASSANRVGDIGSAEFGIRASK